MTLDSELDNLTVADCRRCSHSYQEHGDAGGHCLGRLGGWASPAVAIPCPCPHFRWIDAGGPPGGYESVPSPAF